MNDSRSHDSSVPLHIPVVSTPIPVGARIAETVRSSFPATIRPLDAHATASLPAAYIPHSSTRSQFVNRVSQASAFRSARAKPCSAPRKSAGRIYAAQVPPAPPTRLSVHIFYTISKRGSKALGGGISDGRATGHRFSNVALAATALIAIEGNDPSMQQLAHAFVNQF